MDQQELNFINLASQFSRGTIVDAQVKVVKSFEAIVELRDGTPGILRNRELCWGAVPEHAGEFLRRGQNVKAVVVGIDQLKHRLKLSLRQVERDPWNAIEQRYAIGQLARCKVTSLLPKVAIVELEPGVEGYIPLREICEPHPKRIDELIWVGDTVDAVITNLKHRKRRLILSIRKHLNFLAKRADERERRRYIDDGDRIGAALIDRIKAEDRLTLLNLSSFHPHQSTGHDTTAPLASRLHRVLIADDDPSFRISLESLLTKLGHKVTAVAHAEDTVRMCSEAEYDLVLIDMKFRHSGMDGLEAVEAILANNRNIPIVVVTGTTSVALKEDLARRVRTSGARGLLLKPVALASLTGQMRAISAGDDCWQTEYSITQSGAVSAFDSAINPLNSNIHLQKALRAELLNLQHATRATACILFKMELDARVVRVLANTGARLAGYDSSKHTLQASPVDSVIRQQIELFEEDTTHNPERFKYLNLIEYTSCMGLPVLTLAQTKHGVFLFHTDKQHFSHDDLREARMTCRTIGSILDREEVKQIVLKIQPLAFTGQVGSTLIHELNNRLGSVVNFAETLLMEHQTIEDDVSAAMDFRLRERIKNCVQNIHGNSKGMQEIARSYSGLTKVANREVIRLNDIVQRVMSILLPLAETNHVKISSELEEELPATIAVESWLEQTFINIALNAIQHLNSAKGGGELLIQTKFARHERPSLQVEFIDNGPGIHGQNLMHIFDLGFSTRSGGTGLGLFTSRGLIEALGGTLVVTSSVMLMGTTFMVELPLVVPSMEEFGQ